MMPTSEQRESSPSAGELDPPVVQDEPESRPGGIPLYVWVIAAVVVAIPLGLFWGEGATSLEILPRLILRALTALAAPLVVLAILSAIVTNDIHGRQGAPDDGLLPDQHPGRDAHRPDPDEPGPAGHRGRAGRARRGGPDRWPGRPSTDLLIELVPRSIGEAFTQNNLAQLVLLTLALGIGLVRIRDAQRARGETSFQTVIDLLTIGFELLMKVLLWVVALVPLAVLGHRGLERRPEGGDAGLPLPDLADRRGGRRAGLPGDLVSAPDGGLRADVAGPVPARGRST